MLNRFMTVFFAKLVSLICHCVFPLTDLNDCSSSVPRLYSRNSRSCHQSAAGSEDAVVPSAEGLHVEAVSQPDAQSCCVSVRKQVDYS